MFERENIAIAWKKDKKLKTEEKGRYSYQREPKAALLDLARESRKQREAAGRERTGGTGNGKWGKDVICVILDRGHSSPVCVEACFWEKFLIFKTSGRR